MKYPLFVRRLGSANLLEVFLVLAIGTVLVIRAVLALSNYPQLGGNGLHIAHMLWGGLAMLAALVLLLSSLNRSARVVSAVMGGIGFGFFIDEVGKFVTSDNNYFFRPAISIIYITFILLYLATRALASDLHASPRTYLANALELAMEGALRPVPEAEWKRGRELLDRSDRSDPKVDLVAQLIDKLETLPPAGRGLLGRLADAVSRGYANLVRRPWYSRLVVVIFALSAGSDLLEAGMAAGPMAMLPVSLVVVLLLVLFCLWLARLQRPRWQKTLMIAGVAAAGIAVLVAAFYNSRQPQLQPMNFADLVHLLATVVAGIIGVIGVWQLRKSRLAAYRMFMRALLVSLLVGQVFAFYEEQFWALLGLVASLFMWVTLRLLIHAELQLAEERTKEVAPA